MMLQQHDASFLAILNPSVLNGKFSDKTIGFKAPKPDVFFRRASSYRKGGAATKQAISAATKNIKIFISAVGDREFSSREISEKTGVKSCNVCRTIHRINYCFHDIIEEIGFDEHHSKTFKINITRATGLFE